MHLRHGNNKYKKLLHYRDGCLTIVSNTDFRTDIYSALELKPYLYSVFITHITLLLIICAWGVESSLTQQSNMAQHSIIITRSSYHLIRFHVGRTVQNLYFRFNLCVPLIQSIKIIESKSTNKIDKEINWNVKQMVVQKILKCMTQKAEDRFAQQYTLV